MKNKSLFFSKLFVFKALTAILFLNSCSKEELNQNQQISLDKEFGLHTKELIVYDKSQKNSAVLLLGSNDKSVLNMWTAENFNLVPIKEGQSLMEILNLNETDTITIDSIPDNNEELKGMVAAEISYMIISKELDVGVNDIVLIENPPYSENMRGWKYSTYYSEAVEGNTVTVNIYGRNFWRKGYYGISYLKYYSSNWSTIAGEWTRIRRNENRSYTRNPCYRMKARRKYKGSNNSVIINFEY